MDIQDVRRAVMRHLVESAYDNNARKFADAVKKSASQINDTLAGRKSFGEKVAWSMADELKLGRDYFDKIENAGEHALASYLAAEDADEYNDAISQVVALMKEMDREGRAEVLGAARVIHFTRRNER